MTPTETLHRNANTERAPAGLLYGLSLAQLISWGTTIYLFPLLLQPMEQALHISRAEVSLAISLALFGEGAAAYAVGRWIDRGHARAVMSAGSALAALALLAHTQVRTLAGLYAVWAVLGVAMACTLYPPVFAVVTRRFPHDYRRAIITLTFLGGLASTVIMPLTAWLMQRWGWQAALAVLAALHAFVCLPLHAALLRGEPRQPVAHASAPPQALREQVRSPQFLLIGAFTVIGMSIQAALPAHLVQLLRERGLSDTWAVAVPAAVGAVQVVGRAMVYALDARLSVHRINRLIVLLMPAALAVLLLAGHSPLLALLFAALYGIANGTFTILKGTAVAQYVSHRNVAALNGALGFPSAVGRAVAPLALGLAWSAQLGYTLGVAGLLAASALNAVVFAAAQRHALASRQS